MLYQPKSHHFSALRQANTSSVTTQIKPGQCCQPECLVFIVNPHITMSGYYTDTAVNVKTTIWPNTELLN